jgi:hypothetical protein
MKLTYSAQNGSRCGRRIAQSPAAAQTGTFLFPGLIDYWWRDRLARVAERVRFELTCRNYPTIRFRVGAVMTTSVPLH